MARGAYVLNGIRRAISSWFVDSPTVGHTYKRCFQVTFFTHGEPLLNANVLVAA